MTRPARPTPPDRAQATSASGSGSALTILLAWLVPGAGHFLNGQVQKASVFGVTLLLMFAFGLGFGGRLFPLQSGDILVLLAALAEWGLLLPRAVAVGVGAGRGDVVAATYEYGNAFLIAAGLLNVLVVMDAADLATGRKPR
ncbi:MAG TPA: DUF6677 family protein [Vicinamibacterales bacterium]|nr:DUF6677 family protein [Vicinamibacterales bacterium]